MARRTVVLAFFRDEADADDAVEQMKAWDKWDDDVKLNAIGVLALDDKGKLKTHKLGKRSVGKGAGIGLVLAVIAPPTLLAGVVGGGLLGAFHRKNLGMKGADRDRIAAQLQDGRAAVGVLVAEDQADAVSTRLSQLGGTPETHEVTEEVVAEVEEAAPAVEAAEAEAGDDLTIIDGVGPAYAVLSRRPASRRSLSWASRRPRASPRPDQWQRAAHRRPQRGHLAAPGQARSRGDWLALRRYIDSSK